MTRLIRVRFPQLIDHVLPLVAPIELAARLAKKEAVRRTVQASYLFYAENLHSKYFRSLFYFFRLFETMYTTLSTHYPARDGGCKFLLPLSRSPLFG